MGPPSIDWGNDCSACTGANETSFVSSETCVGSACQPLALNQLQTQVIQAMSNFTLLVQNLTALSTSQPQPWMYGAFVNDAYPVATCIYQNSEGVNSAPYPLPWVTLPQSGAYSCQQYCANNINYVSSPMRLKILLR